MLRKWLSRPNSDFRPLRPWEILKYIKLKRRYANQAQVAEPDSITNQEFEELLSYYREIRHRTRRPAVTLSPERPVEDADWGCTMLGCIRSMPQGMRWPTHEGCPMLPLLQLRITDLAFHHSGLSGFQYLLVWAAVEMYKGTPLLDWKRIQILPVSISETIVRSPETHAQEPVVPHVAQLSLVEDSIDHCESRLFDCLGKQRSKRANTLYFERSISGEQQRRIDREIMNHKQSKVGGWPYNQQHFADFDGTADYVLQICSDHKTGIMFSDMGSLYIGKQKKTGKFVSEVLF